MASSLSQISRTSRWILTFVSPTTAPIPIPIPISMSRLLTFTSLVWLPAAGSSALGSWPTDLERYTSTFKAEGLTVQVIHKQYGAQCNSTIKIYFFSDITSLIKTWTFYLLGVEWGYSESITADLIGGEREGLSCGCLQRDGALEGAQGDWQTTRWPLHRNTKEKGRRCWVNIDQNTFIHSVFSSHVFFKMPTTCLGWKLAVWPNLALWTHPFKYMAHLLSLA